MNTLERTTAHARVPLRDIAAFLPEHVRVDVVRYTEHVDEGPRRIPCNELCLRLDEDAAETLARAPRIPRYTPDDEASTEDDPAVVVRWTAQASIALGRFLQYLDGLREIEAFHRQYADHPPNFVTSTLAVGDALVDAIAPAEEEHDRPAEAA